MCHLAVVFGVSDDGANILDWQTELVSDFVVGKAGIQVINNGVGRNAIASHRGSAAKLVGIPFDDGAF